MGDERPIGTVVLSRRAHQTQKEVNRQDAAV